jgi:hypothetical protein
MALTSFEGFFFEPQRQAYAGHLALILIFCGEKSPFGWLWLAKSSWHIS